MRSDMSHINDDLLVKYLLGEATETERSEVQEWIDHSEANRKHFEHFKLIWDESKKIASTSTVNVDDAWGRFQQRTQQQEERPKTITLPAKPINWMRAAAVLVLLAGAGWMAYNLSTNKSVEPVSVHSGNKILVDTLPDGSVITLNKNSSLAYNSKLDGDTRNVKLKGEAFFNVAPDKEHPFIIDVNGATVTVVGTAFNVKSTEGKTEVIVESGIVDVAKNQKAVRLNPSEKATVLIDKDAPFKESNTDELYNYYKTKELVCKNTPLSRLVDVLNEAYDTDIVIGNSSIKNLPMTTTFRDEPLDEILATICRTHNLQVERRGEQIILQ
jgi:transmembrane sensor